MFRLFAAIFVAGVAVTSASAECVPATNEEITAVRDLLKRELKDSESARFDNVCKSVRVKNADKPTLTFCGMVNAKNSYGAYAGFKRFWAAKGAKVDDGSTIFESTYCIACVEGEPSADTCFDRTLKMINEGELPRE